MSALRGALVVAVWLAAGCSKADAEGAASDQAGWRGYVETRAASQDVPARFGFGRTASAEEITRLDIDVLPDGTGLPPGSARALDGAPIYAAKCAACHGAAGEGVRGVGSRLVGRRPGDAFDFADQGQLEAEKTIGSYWPYATTIFDYTRRAMPFDRPGSLTDQEVYALTAYMLYMNDIIDADLVIDATTLPRVVMPAAGRFVPDDREGSTRVR